jgi:hypothetical protein
MKFLKALGILAVIVFGLVVVYQLAYPTYAHRYRLTLEVETPEGLKTASGVIEPQLITQPTILTDRRSHGGLMGDAVFVDLGNGKNVTALLASGPSASNVDAPLRLAIEAFEIPNCGEAFCQWRAISRATGQRDLSVELVPTLVTFSDVNDPKSARVIEPGEFETVFEPGYRFKRAWIEMTDDPVTRRIREILPWIDDYKAEKSFEQRLRETGGPGGGSRMPGMNLSRP